MFYFIFRKYFIRLKHDIERQDAERMAKEILPAGVRKISYDYLPDGHPLHKCNLYIPNGLDSRKLPLVLDIHGGAWICGDKDTNDNFNHRLAKMGFAVASLSYRTVDECTIAEQIRDIFAWLHFLTDNAETLNVDPRNAVLTGDSAGAQLALLSWKINRSKKLQTLFGVRPAEIEIQCMALNHGVCFMDCAGRLPENRYISRWVAEPGLRRIVYGKDYKKSEIYRLTYSPAAFLTQEDELPPVLLISGRGDRIYSYQTLLLKDFLESVGAVYELYFEEKESAGHVFNLVAADTEEGRKCNERIAEFFREHSAVPKAQVI